MGTAGICTATDLVIRNDSTCHCGEPAVWLCIDWERRTATPRCRTHYAVAQFPQR